MKQPFPQPPAEAIVYENNHLYVCLASFPIAPGHTVVVWKKPVSDLHLLKRKEYEELMDAVDIVRSAMLKALRVKKVYLVYMDEIKHVHWHLIPRHNEQGYNVLLHKPGKLKDFSLSKKIKQALKKSG